MKKPTIRNNAYWLSRLKAEHPEIHEAYVLGAHPSVADACRAAGMVKARTQIQILKSAWGKASLTEHKAFKLWLGLPLDIISGIQQISARLGV